MWTIEYGITPELLSKVIMNTLHIRASSALYKIIALLKCFKWLSGSKFPLKCVMDDIVNCFRGVAYSTSSMKGEELTLSTSLRRASSVLSLSWRL
ncbi:unnamed protein product [Prunus armeniaca]